MSDIQLAPSKQIVQHSMMSRGHKLITDVNGELGEAGLHYFVDEAGIRTGKRGLRLLQQGGGYAAQGNQWLVGIADKNDD